MPVFKLRFLQKGRRDFPFFILHMSQTKQWKEYINQLRLQNDNTTNLCTSNNNKVAINYSSLSAIFLLTSHASIVKVKFHSLDQRELKIPGTYVIVTINP